MATDKTNSLQLLIQRRFRWIFSVQTLGCYNDSLFKNAFIILLTYKMFTIGALQPESLIFIGAGFFILPFIFLSPFCGQIATKYPKAKLIRYCKLFEIVTSATAVIAFVFHIVPLMLLVLLALGVQSTLFVTTKLGMVPEISQTKEYLAVNGLFDMGLFLGSIIGTLMGGMIILTHYGPAIVATIMLCISILSYLAAWRIPVLPAIEPERKLHWNWFSKIAKLSTNLKGNHLCVTALLGIAWFWFLATIFIMQMSNYVKNYLHLNGDLATFYLMLLSLGIALGAAVCEKLRSQQIEFRISTLGAIGMSIFVFIFALAHVHTTPLSTDTAFFANPYNWISILSALMIGAAGAFYMVPLYAIIHHTTDKKTCANIICLNNVIYSVFVILAAVMAVMLIQLGWSSRDLFLLAAILNVIFNVFLFIREPRYVKSLLPFGTSN